MPQRASTQTLSVIRGLPPSGTWSSQVRSSASALLLPPPEDDVEDLGGARDHS